MQTRGFRVLTCPANGERSYGETYTVAIDATGFVLSTVQTAKHVASAYEPCNRLQGLPWTHHFAAVRYIGAQVPALMDRSKPLVSSPSK